MKLSDVEHQRDHFEAVSEKYFKARQNANHLTLKRLLWNHFLSGKAELFGDPIRVLEPMCGYSEGRQILETHLRSAIVYAGFDFSRPLVDEARERYPNDQIYLQDITQWEPQEQYGVVIIIGGLHHVYAHTRDVLARISRAVKPGGYFINFEPTQNNALFRWIRNRIYQKNSLFDAQTERAFELDELNDHFRQAGFDIVDQIYPGLLAYTLYYNPDAFPTLNVGSPGWVEALFGLEKHAYRSWLARKFSFATLSLLRKGDKDAGHLFLDTQRGDPRHCETTRADRRGGSQ